MYVLERSVLDLIPPGRSVSIERDVFPRLVGDGLYGAARSRATGWTSAPPSATCRRAGTSSRAGGDAGRADPAPGCASTAAAPRSPSGAVTVGPRAVVGPGCRVGAAAPRCANRSCSMAAWSARARAVGGSILAPGVEVERRAPSARAAPWSAENERVLGSSSRCSTTCSPFPITCATPSGGSSRRGSRPAESAGLAGLRDGRLGDRRRPRRRGARRAPHPAAVDGARLRAAGLGAPEWTVLCSSYSGETEETLACFEAAGALGARRDRRQHRRRAGRRPRAARRAGDRPAGDPAAAGRRRLHVRVARRGRRAGRGGAADPRPRSRPPPTCWTSGRGRAARPRRRDRRAGSAGTVPVGLRRRADARRSRERWKTQVNENAKLPAFFSELPEADHNEICGWDGRAGGARSRRVMLEDADQHPRVRRRFELTAEAIARRRRRGDAGRDRGRDAAPRGCSGR